MKAKKNLIVTIILLAIFLAVVQVTQVAGKAEQKATTTPRVKFVTEQQQREILAGLQGVYVLVVDFSPEDEKYGLNKERFKTDVELRLRQYGVKVLSNMERFLASGQPYLYINVNPKIEEKIGLAAINISVQLKEKVLLVRNPTIITAAATWKAQGVAMGGLDNIAQVRELVKDLVDEFINDYLAANPKVQTPQQKTEK